MSLHLEILPRPDASAQQLKRLGHALLVWSSACLDRLIEAGQDADAWLDMDAIDDLLVGELPRPFVLRCGVPGMTATELADALATARRRYTLLRRALPSPESRAVLFGLSLGCDAAEEVVASLRRHVPMELVGAVRINGRECGPSAETGFHVE
jgi:hypothetical protein